VAGGGRPAGLETRTEEELARERRREEEEEDWWGPLRVKWSFHSSIDTVSSESIQNGMGVNKLISSA
jgi:hypothetical protein